MFDKRARPNRGHTHARTTGRDDGREWNENNDGPTEQRSRPGKTNHGRAQRDDDRKQDNTELRSDDAVPFQLIVVVGSSVINAR